MLNMALKVINGVQFDQFQHFTIKSCWKCHSLKFFAVLRSSQPSLRFQEMEPLNVLFRWIRNCFQPNVSLEHWKQLFEAICKCPTSTTVVAPRIIWKDQNDVILGDFGSKKWVLRNPKILFFLSFFWIIRCKTWIFTDKHDRTQRVEDIRKVPVVC